MHKVTNTVWFPESGLTICMYFNDLSYLCKWVRIYIVSHTHLRDEKAIIMKSLSQKGVQGFCQTAFLSALLLLRMIHPNLSRCFLATPYVFYIERQTKRNWGRYWFINGGNVMLTTPVFSRGKTLTDIMVSQ